ncbi:hypothetical protein BC828DRAFT_391847 [Blastocladiella britannica]|nr:hypothetical protein BC828DRAFT_391847 [Blastocladiella britannica]
MPSNVPPFRTRVLPPSSAPPGTASRLATVRYSGPIAGTQGVWYGVEWDDTQGKHAGAIKGTQYFECSAAAMRYADGISLARTGIHGTSAAATAGCGTDTVATTTITPGSFIRPIAGTVLEPVPILDMVCERYNVTLATAEPDHLDATTDSVVSPPVSHGGVDVQHVTMAGRRGAGAGIDVELVGFDKVVAKQRIDKLMEASLVDIPAGVLHDPALLRVNLASLTSLDLSGTLFGSWVDIANLCRALPTLHTLHLNRLRLAMPNQDKTPLAGAFDQLRLLTLNNTYHSRQEYTEILNLMPGLTELHLGFNALREAPALTMPALQSLNLQNNAIDPESLPRALSGCPLLRQLNLQYNGLKSLPGDPDSGIDSNSNDDDGASLVHGFPALEALWVHDNALDDWRTAADVLADTRVWPSLREVRFNRNPVTLRATDSEVTLVELVGRIPGLRIMNRSEVLPQQRVSCELYFLKLTGMAIAAARGATTPVPDQLPESDPDALFAALLETPERADVVWRAYPRVRVSALMRHHGATMVVGAVVGAAEASRGDRITVAGITVVAGTSTWVVDVVAATTTVRALRAMVARKLRAMPRRVRLVAGGEAGGGEEMADDGKLVDWYGVEGGSVVEATVS